MQSRDVIAIVGGCVAILGLIIETVGILAMAYYGVRRRLRSNPLALQSCGAILFTLGALTVALTVCRR